MKRDDIELLRRANPASDETGYADNEIRRRVDDIVGSDHVLVVATSGDSPVQRGRARKTLVPLLAAAVILLVASVAAVLVSRGHRSGDAVAPGSSPVTCTVSTSGGTATTRDREALATQVISARVRDLGGTARAFSYDAAAGTIGFTPHDLSPATAATACRTTTTSIRPLVTRPVTVDDNTARSSDPLTSLRFPVPTDESRYVRLTHAEQTQLAAAMSHYDCSARPAAGSSSLVCASATGVTQVYLLGPQLAGEADVETATPIGPQAGGSAPWTVGLSLRADAAARVEAFTAHHNTAGVTGNLAQCASTGKAPCGDFLAFTVDGMVISVPQIEATISGTVQIAADLTQHSATSLAADFTAAAIRLGSA